jgi:DNA-binding MarR family transcriptional regulator
MERLERIDRQQLRVSPLQDPCAALRRASRSISHLYDLVLAPTGLKATQFIILHAIAERIEVAQWRLADEYGISDDTLSRRLALLRRKGFITQRIGCEHPGERLYRLTELGMQRVQDAIPYWQRAEDRLRRAIGSTDDWDLLLNTADRICAAAQAAELGRFANTVPIRVKAAVAS